MLVKKLRAKNKLDWSRAVIDSSGLHGFRRPRIRWERRDDIHEAFLGLAVRLITHRHVKRLCQGLSHQDTS
ncbi:hypothetical protein [Streptomyces griseochromogenes]|uniref:hypothetical protein n=1 Tax=Streptomyces griseochromogenes TaxID=68214 RepID=UPI0037A57259